MFYRPTLVAKMWDTWLYCHNGVHYLYYLHETDGTRFDGMSLATSTDGVHWQEVGSIIEKDDDAEWLGTGSVWRAGDQFVLNYSEQRQGVQAVFFAVSDDLVHWKRLGDCYRCDVDPRWYDNTATGRWDCIWAVPRADGQPGFVGYLTARPWTHTPGMRYESVGKVASDDGLHWHAVEPPVIEWGDWPAMDLGEVGAIEQIGDKFYLILGYNENGLGNRHVAGPYGPRLGMYTFVSDSPEGPFHVDQDAYRLLTSNTEHRPMTYFARFYPSPDGMLVTHHTISREDVRWMPSLKRAVIDDDGHLSLGYWKGNEAVKGRKLPLGTERMVRVRPTDHDPDIHLSAASLTVDQPHGGGLALFPETFDLAKGLVFEGYLTVHEPNLRWGGAGVYIEQQAQPDRGTALMSETRGCTEIGRLDPGRAFVPDDNLPIGLVAGRRTHLRLLVRASLIEYYLDERLVQCYSLPDIGSGRIGLVWESGQAMFDELVAWEFNL
ncbi:MAG: glycoside hydrolase family protein [Anaerolineae bacterium]